MDFNQIAKNTLMQVQSELALGKNEISWTVYEPIIDLEAYRQEVKKYYGFRARLETVYGMIAVVCVAFIMMSIWFAGIAMGTYIASAAKCALFAGILYAVWEEWKNRKARQKALGREYFTVQIDVDFKKRRFMTTDDEGGKRKLKFHQNINLPAFNLPENAAPSEIAQRDSLQNDLVRKMGVRFVEYKVWG